MAGSQIRLSMGQAEAAVIRAVDVATPATVAVVVAVAAAIDSASAGFWLGESRHTEMEEWWELRIWQFSKKREVSQFIMLINFWVVATVSKVFWNVHPAKFWEDEPNLTSHIFQMGGETHQPDV